MKNKTKQTKRVRLTNEMPKFSRLVSVGIKNPKVEKKKKHTNTKIKVKKQPNKVISRNIVKSMYSEVKNVEYNTRMMNRQLSNNFEHAALRYADSNNKDNKHSVNANLNKILFYCNKVRKSLDRIEDLCNSIKSKYSL